MAQEESGPGSAGTSIGRIRNVTRGYVSAVIFFATVTSIALTIAAWGVLAYVTATDPAPGSAPVFVLPVAVLCAAAAQAWLSWQQSLQLLRGRIHIPVQLLAATAAAVYLVWVVAAVSAGSEYTRVFFSVYALCFVLAAVTGQMLAYGVLLRRVYTAKEAPLWPWERREKREIDELNELWNNS